MEKNINRKYITLKGRMFQQHLKHEIDKGINISKVGIFAHSLPLL